MTTREIKKLGFSTPVQFISKIKLGYLSNGYAEYRKTPVYITSFDKDGVEFSVGIEPCVSRTAWHHPSEIKLYKS